MSGTFALCGRAAMACRPGVHGPKSGFLHVPRREVKAAVARGERKPGGAAFVIRGGDLPHPQHDRKKEPEMFCIKPALAAAAILAMAACTPGPTTTTITTPGAEPVKVVTPPDGDSVTVVTP